MLQFKGEHGAVLKNNMTASMNGLLLINCLITAQKTNKEPYRTLKTVLVEHMEKNYPKYSFERPAGMLYLHIPNTITHTDFFKFYDAAAYHLGLWCSTTKEPLTKDNMEKALSDLITNKTITPPPTQEELQVVQSVDPKPEPKQVKLNNLLKQNLNMESKNDIGFGRSKPILISYKSKKNDTRKKLLKESSLTMLDIEGMKDLFKIINLADRDECIAKFIAHKLPASDKANDKPALASDAKKYLEGMYVGVKTQDADKLEENVKKLKELFDQSIRKERAYAAIAAIFARILTGPASPKVKFLGIQDNPYHGQLLSGFVEGCDIFDELAAEKDLSGMAPQIAAAATVRVMLGNDFDEMKLENFRVTSERDVVNIDMDQSFGTENQLGTVFAGCEGAKALFKNTEEAFSQRWDEREEHKRYWDKLFKDNNEAVKKAMLGMFERATLVLTLELVTYVVYSIRDSYKEFFSLSEEDCNHVIKFMNRTRETSAGKVLEIRPLSKDPKDVPDWLKGIIDDASKYHAQKNSNNNNNNNGKTSRMSHS